jgi:type I restriction enzyme S subunit
LDGLKEYTGKYKPEQVVDAGDLIIAYTDVTQAADIIGKPALVISDSRYQNLVISLDVAVIRPNDDVLKYYLYGLAKTDSFQSHVLSHTTGTTVLHLSKVAVPDFLFVKASKELLAIFDKHVRSSYQIIDLNVSKSRKLSSIRDTLLPKLISGELRV